MSTYTIHPQERHHHATEMDAAPPTVLDGRRASLAAVVAGVLIGILFSLVLAGAPAATQHRAGGHALATVAAAQHAATATTGTAHTVIGATAAGSRAARRAAGSRPVARPQPGAASSSCAPRASPHAEDSRAGRWARARARRGSDARDGGPVTRGRGTLRLP